MLPGPPEHIAIAYSYSNLQVMLSTESPCQVRSGVSRTQGARGRGTPLRQNLIGWAVVTPCASERYQYPVLQAAERERDVFGADAADMST